MVDPYIRNFHQVRNLFEFLRVVLELQEPGDEVAVQLQTARAFEGESDQLNLLEQVRDAFQTTAITFDFTVQENSALHARYITTDTGWKITLDRGLDIFQPFDRRDAFNLQNTNQELRRCRAFEVTYLRV